MYALNAEDGIRLEEMPGSILRNADQLGWNVGSAEL